MKRLVFIIALAVAVSSLGAPVSMAFEGNEMPCCSGERGCSQGLERASCCETPAATNQAAVLMTLVRMVPVPTSNVAQDMTLELACGKMPPSDQDDNPQEESTLYLQYESILI